MMLAAGRQTKTCMVDGAGCSVTTYTPTYNNIEWIGRYLFRRQERSLKVHY